jgi:hypothetical protein
MISGFGKRNNMNLQNLRAKITLVTDQSGYIICDCKSRTTFLILNNEVFLFSCFKNGVVKNPLDTKHPEVCLWCGKSLITT